MTYLLAITDQTFTYLAQVKRRAKRRVTIDLDVFTHENRRAVILWV